MFECLVACQIHCTFKDRGGHLRYVDWWAFEEPPIFDDMTSYLDENSTMWTQLCDTMSDYGYHLNSVSIGPQKLKKAYQIIDANQCTLMATELELWNAHYSD